MCDEYGRAREKGEGWEWGACMVMVGVGASQPLACAILSGGLPWAGRTVRRYTHYHWCAVHYVLQLTEHEVTFTFGSLNMPACCEASPRYVPSRAGLDGSREGKSRSSVEWIYKSKAPLCHRIGLITSPSIHSSPGQVARVGGSDKRLQYPHTYN